MNAPAADPVPAPLRVHDPALIQDGEWSYVFATGRGVPIRRSRDLVAWEQVGTVFPDNVPGWAARAIPGARDLWAPDISWWAGEYRLYYSVSTFGSQRSAIGLATNKALDPSNPAYRWVDRGLVVDSVPARDDFNAIDPNVLPDDPDDIARDPNRPRIWLTFGSFWGGIQVVGIDAETGKPDPARWGPPRTIAARPGDHAIEAPFLYRKGGWYYLFASTDHCCRGVNSDYKVVVGRSRRADGPYVDLDGRPMTEGGGTTVIASSGTTRGPGHNAVARLADGSEVFVHHYYDAADRGMPKLQVRCLAWGADGFPLAGEVRRGAREDGAGRPAAPDPGSLRRRWDVSVDFAEPRPIRLLDGGGIEGDRPGAHWSLAGRTLRLDWGGGRVGECVVAPDGRSFVGRDAGHEVIRGTARDD